MAGMFNNLTMLVSIVGVQSNLALESEQSIAKSLFLDYPDLTGFGPKATVLADRV